MRGRPANKAKPNDTLRCMRCNGEYPEKEFYNTDSILGEAYGKIPYCKSCVNDIYQHYLKKYTAYSFADPDRKAIERLCMLFDVYYNDTAFDIAQAKCDNNPGSLISGMYMGVARLAQYKKKNYDTTMLEKYNEAKKNNGIMTVYTERDSEKYENIESGKKLFGKGFDDDEYLYLYDQYCDWTARHECNTKAQEEVFKNICLTQLQLMRATKAGDDTKDLSVQLQRWLDTGKLQPKQNSGESVSDAQTFGTLIDKWENTRPIPEIDEELRDVDKIGLYIDVFFRGHLAKMAGMKNALSNLYDDYIKKYTVDKPEYDDEEDDEALFDAIFGTDSNMEDEGV